MNLHRLTLALIATSMIAGAPAQANDIEDFIEDWLGVRRGYSQRYDDFHRHREQRYGDYHRDERPGEIDWEGWLPGYAPGYYTIPLPGGGQFGISIESPPDPNGFAANQVLQYARDMEPYVRAVRSSAYRLNDPQPRRLADRVAEDLQQLIAAAGLGDVAAVERHHHSFDTNWQRLAHSLQRYEWDNRMQQYLTTIRDIDNRLHHALQGQAGYGYDHLRLIALSRQLRERTEHLADDLRFEPGQSWQGNALRRQAERASRHAADFAEFVS